MTAHQLTHWCPTCDKHYALNQVRQVFPDPASPEDEITLILCPDCGGSDVEELQEVGDAQ